MKTITTIETDVIKRAKEKLDAVINSGTNLEGNQTVLNLSKKWRIYLSDFRIHPVTSRYGTLQELHEAQKKHLIDNIDDIVAI